MCVRLKRRTRCGLIITIFLYTNRTLCEGCLTFLEAILKCKMLLAWFVIKLTNPSYAKCGLNYPKEIRKNIQQLLKIFENFRIPPLLPPQYNAIINTQTDNFSYDFMCAFTPPLLCRCRSSDFCDFCGFYNICSVLISIWYWCRVWCQQFRHAVISIRIKIKIDLFFSNEST